MIRASVTSFVNSLSISKVLVTTICFLVSCFALADCPESILQLMPVGVYTDPKSMQAFVEAMRTDMGDACSIDGEEHGRLLSVELLQNREQVNFIFSYIIDADGRRLDHNGPGFMAICFTHFSDY